MQPICIECMCTICVYVCMCMCMCVCVQSQAAIAGRVRPASGHRWPLAAIPSLVNIHVCVVYMRAYVRVGTCGKHARVCAGM